MDEKNNILRQAAEGEINFLEAVAKAAAQAGSTENIGVARLDHARRSRCGFPEFVYGAGKSESQLMRIIPALLEHESEVLVTRVEEPVGLRLAAAFPEGGYDPLARVFRVVRADKPLHGQVAVVTAGTSDLGVAMEAAYTLEHCGIEPKLVCDVGVAAIERVLACVSELRAADACIVVAGMEGALPSVIGGLLKTPVIAVPTSVGYGAAQHGMAALLGMLNSCASGVTVVNIDNGFGAACAAARMIKHIR